MQAGLGQAGFGSAVIGEDLTVKGDIRSRGTVDVRGVVEGSVSAVRVAIYPGGKVLGILKADTADVYGLVQGTITVRQLLNIGSTGVVRGDVRYGSIAMAAGGELAAEMRNIPPELAGDFEVAVRRGRSIAITVSDISAYDPDNTAGQLTFTVASPRGGVVARLGAEGAGIDRFTQAELQAGGILFVHDGRSSEADFEVVVTDAAGASSGAPRKVRVAVV